MRRDSVYFNANARGQVIKIKIIELCTYKGDVDFKKVIWNYFKIIVIYYLIMHRGIFGIEMFNSSVANICDFIYCGLLD
jgi:hypothetical protein